MTLYASDNAGALLIQNVNCEQYECNFLVYSNNKHLLYFSSSNNI